MFYIFTLFSSNLTSLKFVFKKNIPLRASEVSDNTSTSQGTGVVKCTGSYLMCVYVCVYSRVFTDFGGFSTVRYVLKACSCCWTPTRELANFLLLRMMMVCSIHSSRSEASDSYFSIIFSVSMALSRTYRGRSSLIKLSQNSPEQSAEVLTCLRCCEELGHLSNPLPFHLQSLHLGEVVIVRDHVGDDGLLIRVVHTDVCAHTQKIGVRVYRT